MTYPLWLLIVFSAYWIIWALRPADRKLWFADNFFAIALVVLLVFTYRRWPLSHLSYTLVFIFMCLQTIGAHYTYSKVPYDRWIAKFFGRGLTDVLGLKRNHFDRLVHFGFGLLLAYPAQEILVTRAHLGSGWSQVLAASVIMSLSMLFEVIEWVLAALLGGAAGKEYLAAQGDEWDAQKDMAAASLGAVLAMGATAMYA